MRFSQLIVRVLAPLLALVMLGSACGASASVDDTTRDASAAQASDSAGEAAGDSSEQPEETPTEPPQPTEPPAPAPTETPVPEPDPTATAVPEPAVSFWIDALSVGDCFNRADLTGEFGEVPEPISCDDLHEEEIFAQGLLDDGPDAPYPGEDATFDRAWTELCESAVVDFAGRPYDELPFTVFGLFPTEAEWDAGDRGIMCSAASHEEGRLKIGTAAAGTLDVDANLVVRTSLSTPEAGEFEDWLILDRATLQDDAVSLTDGSFDLQLRRPGGTSEGIVFNATLVGADSFATQMTTINFVSGEAGEISLPVDGLEYSGTVAYSGSMVFAARESDEADWNLFAISDADPGAVLGDSEADEHYPTLSPDGQTVVFHRDGDLWRSNIDGSNQLQLTNSPANEWESEISPDGQWIAFVSDLGGSDDLWLMTIDGQEIAQLTNHPGDEIWPTWSVDSSTIFFASDRFSPEGNHSSIMAMQPGDAVPSYFSTFQNIGHPLVISPQLADAAAAVFPTLGDRYFGAEDSGGDVIGVEPGALRPWEHGAGGLVADLPENWTTLEDATGGFASVLASPDIERYFETWAVDGINISLHRAPDMDTFVAQVFDQAAAVSDDSCTLVDSSDGVQVLENGSSQIGKIFECGSAHAQVFGVFDPADGVGLLLEGQRDNAPDATTDEELLDAIAASVRWN